MTKVVASDLVAVQSSSLFGNISKVGSLSSSMDGSISKFRSESPSTLKGDGYDMVRTKMSIYEDAYNKQAKLCEILANNIQAANNSMLNYMEDYSVLDDSLVPEIEAKFVIAPNGIDEYWIKNIQLFTAE